MKGDGGSFGHLGVHVGSDWSIWCSTYPAHSPILTIDAASTSIAFTIADERIGDQAVAFARDLVCKAERFAAEVERLHTGQATSTGDKPAGAAA